MAGRMGEIDSAGLMDGVRAPSVAERCHAAWVVLGSAGAFVTDHVPEAIRKDAQDVLSMLDVLAPDVLKHHPKRRGRRRVVRKHG